MTAAIEHILFLGEPAVRVTTEKLEATVVPGWGSNLISLAWRPTGTALLRTPASAEAYHARTTLHGIPVLFPPSRIENGAFAFQGREYRFPVDPARGYHIHGVLMRAAWRLSAAETTEDGAYVETTVVSEETPAIFEALPHRFTVRLGFRFTADAVEMKFRLESRDELAMPWGLGYHTTFVLPFAGEARGDLSQCSIRLRADKTWALNDRLLPTGELLDNPLREELAAGLPLDRVEFDDCFQASPGAPVEATLEDRGAGLSIRYEADETFTQWVLYNGKGKPDRGFFCPEPLTWVPNAPNVDAPASVTGLQTLEPGATAEAVTRLTIAAL